MRMMDRAVSATHRVIDTASPYAGAQFGWAVSKRRGHLNKMLLDQLVSPGDIAIDVGANAGVFTARLQRLVGPTGHVYACEPLPAHEVRLRRLAKRRNLTFSMVAASDSPGSTTLRVPVVDGVAQTGLATLGAYRPWANEQTFNVELMTVDEVARTRSRPVAFMKIDVEGHEDHVLAGAPDVLADGPSMLVEIEQRHHEGPIQEIIDRILALGFRGWYLTHNGLVPAAEFDVERDQLRHLDEMTSSNVPTGYVNDFLFLRGSLPPPALLAPR